MVMNSFPCPGLPFTTSVSWTLSSLLFDAPPDFMALILFTSESTDRFLVRPRSVGRHEAMMPSDTSSMFQNSEVVINTEMSDQ
jgi:hypothetical protein